MKDRGNRALRSAAYWKGQGGSRCPGEPTDPTQRKETKALTPEQQLAAVRQQKLDLATQVDDGGLTTKEYEEQRQKLEDAEWAIREQTLTAKTAPRAQGRTSVPTSTSRNGRPNSNATIPIPL